jgi:predicted phosphate transport protein (TIGR00153 family)
MFRITRREKIFFDFFIDTAKMALTAAGKLDDLVNHYVDVEDKIRAIKDIEHESDLSIHKIFSQLNKSFITPIDREDIHEIAKELDNITDNIESNAQAFSMFHLKSINEDAKRFSALILKSTDELVGVMTELKSLKISRSLMDRIIEVNRIENEGDEVYRSSMEKLFSDGIDPTDIIKWKVIYDFFEDTLDACEDVANIVEGVVMKHA